MGCQRDPQRRAVRLTDQALVAVTVARHTARAQGREPTSADLLLGLAAEPEGWAGHVLRRRSSPLAALAERSGSLPPSLASLEEVVGVAASRARPRPPGTADLLAASVAAGGADLEDLLSACGFTPEDLRVDSGSHTALPSDAIADEALWHSGSETVSAADEADWLEPAARRAVGQVRALGGGAVDLLILLAADHGPIADSGGEIDAAMLNAARRALAPFADAPAAWDAGLDAVLAAARLLAENRLVSPTHLLQAALLAGGSGPAAVLERARADRGEESS